MLTAVVPASGDENKPLVDVVAERIEQAGGQIVGRLIQRRGPSRTKNPGGEAVMRQAAPLSPRTFLGTGKADELAALVRETGAEVVVFCNPVSDTQKRVLEALTGAVVVGPPPSPS